MKQKLQHSQEDTDLGKRVLEALDDIKNGDFVEYRYPAKAKKAVKNPNVKRLRAKLGMDRDEFAYAFNLSKYSVRNWELGVRTPRGPALALLQMIQANPLQAYRLLHPEK